MAEQHDDLSLLLHAYRMTAVYVDSLELIALPAARRLAEADVEGAAHVADSISAALGRILSIGAPLQIRQALADLLFEEDDVEGHHAPDIGV
jgi:hypothetical protein